RPVRRRPTAHRRGGELCPCSRRRSSPAGSTGRAPSTPRPPRCATWPPTWRSATPAERSATWQVPGQPARRRTSSARPSASPSGPTRPGRTPTSSRCGPMATVELTAAFSTVPAAEQEALKRMLTETVEQIAREDRLFSRARLVFTESDERCGLTAELDGVKREGVPLQLDLEQLEDARTSAGARAQLKEALRLYFRRALGR